MRKVPRTIEVRAVRDFYEELDDSTVASMLQVFLEDQGFEVDEIRVREVPTADVYIGPDGERISVPRGGEVIVFDDGAYELRTA